MFHNVIRQFDCKTDIRYGYTRLVESVCVVGGGYSHHNTQVRSFLMHFIEYALLRGSGGYPPCMGSGAKTVAKIVLGHSKELK